MLIAPDTLFAIHPPPPREPERLTPVERLKAAIAAVVAERDHANASGGYEYAQRPISHNWVALDGGRRP